MSIFALHWLLLLLSIGLDLLFGDPRVKWHPIRLLGNLVLRLEPYFFQLGATGRLAGLVFTFVILGAGLALPFAVVVGAFYLPISREVTIWVVGGFLVLLSAFLISYRDLIQHGTAVKAAIEADDLEQVRFQTSMLVSRQSSQMSVSQASRATVESLAENMVDGVIAPLFYLFFLGPFGLLGFKCISTLDSMIGYQNERYYFFGWAAAKLDDLLCWIPARLGWLLLSFAAFLCRGMSGFGALRVGWLQHGFHASPNSGWPMASVAGALKIKLGGPVVRGGIECEERWFGDEDVVENAREEATEEAGAEEILRAQTLLKVTYLLTILFFGVILVLDSLIEIAPIVH